MTVSGTTWEFVSITLFFQCASYVWNWTLAIITLVDGYILFFGCTYCHIGKNSIPINLFSCVLKTKYGTHNSPGTVSSQVRRFCPALLCHSSTIYCCVYYKIYQCGVDKYEKPYLHRIIVVFIVIFWIISSKFLLILCILRNTYTC